MKIPKLSHVELAVGFLIQLPFYYIIGNWVFALALISSVLWALGGAEGSNKAWRRFGVSISTALFLWFFYTQSLLIVLCLPFSILILSMGYGKESRLFKFFIERTQNHRFSDYATRMTTYLAYWFTYGVILFRGG